MLSTAGLQESMNTPEPTRASDRKHFAILVEARLRSRSVTVELVDISEGGCKLRGKLGFAQRDDYITLKINGVRAPAGKVVWVEDHFAGVAFDGSMHPAVLEHLQAQLAHKGQ